MSKIKYKINGYWREIEVSGIIEAVGYKNDEEVDVTIFPESERSEPEL